MNDNKRAGNRPKPRPVHRNYALTAAQAEWLRDTAYRTRISQAELVRRALSDLMQRVAENPATLTEDREDREDADASK